jgi:hypothetical protein
MTTASQPSLARGLLGSEDAAWTAAAALRVASRRTALAAKAYL